MLSASDGQPVSPSHKASAPLPRPPRLDLQRVTSEQTWLAQSNSHLSESDSDCLPSVAASTPQTEAQASAQAAFDLSGMPHPLKSHTANTTPVQPLFGAKSMPGSNGPLAAASTSQLRAARLNALQQPQSSQNSAVHVEMETVPSVPTLAVTGNGSLRLKKSQDNVPPRAARSTHKRAVRLNAGSKTDMFAARVASAMDEARSSDSDETFVYETNLPSDRDQFRKPYVRTPSTSSVPASPRLRIKQTAMLPPTGSESDSSYSNAGTVSHGNTAASQASKYQSQSHPHQHPHQHHQLQHGTPSQSDSMPYPHRPTIRNFVVVRNRPSTSRTDSMRAKSTYLQRWRTSNVEGDDDDDDDDNDDYEPNRVLPRLANESTPLRRHRTKSMRYTRGPGLQLGASPHDYCSPKRQPVFMRLVLAFAMIICILAVGFIAGLLLATSKPLQHVSVLGIEDVVTSDKELVFSMVVQARNPGLLLVSVSHTDLDIFATSAHMADEDEEAGVRQSSSSTTLLGTVFEFQSPLVFSGGIFDSREEWSTATVKLINPASNGTGEPSHIWKTLIAHPFNLTARGTLRYSVLFGGQFKSSVSGFTHVEPPS